MEARPRIMRKRAAGKRLVSGRLFAPGKWCAAGALLAAAFLLSACAQKAASPKDVLWTGPGGGVAIGSLCPDERSAAKKKNTAYRMSAAGACYLNLLAPRTATPALEADAALEVANSWLRRARNLDGNDAFGRTAEGFAFLLKARSASSDEERRKILGEAVTRFRGVLRVRPRSAAAHRLLGRTFTLLERYDAAEREFRLLIESGLGDAGTYAWLGFVFSMRKQKSEAASMWKKSAELGVPALEAGWAAEKLR